MKSYLPLNDKAGQLGEEVPSCILIRGILTIEGHDIIVSPIHLLKEQLHLFCLPPCVFHRPLNDLTDAILWMEFLTIAEIAGVER